jgi:hypothetical protein
MQRVEGVELDGRHGSAVTAASQSPLARWRNGAGMRRRHAACARAKRANAPPEISM